VGQPVLQIIIGSTRPGRIGPAVARYADALRPLRSS